MTLIVSLTTKIFVLLLIGLGATKFNIVGEDTKEHLSKVLVNIALPASMIASSQTKFSESNLEGIGVVGILTLIMYIMFFILGIGIGYIRKSEKTKQVIKILIVSFANTGFLGIPIVTEMVGEIGTLYSVMYNIVFDAIYFSIGLYMIERASQKQEKGIDFKALLSNPMIWVSVSVIIFYIIPFRFPLAITESFSLLGSMMMPISMLVIGMQLSSIKLKEILICKEAMVLTFLRMIIIPTITIAVMLLMGFSKEIAYTMVIMSAMPSASLNAIVANKYKTAPELATIAVTQSTIAFIGVFPLISYILTEVF